MNPIHCSPHEILEDFILFQKNSALGNSVSQRRPGQDRAKHPVWRLASFRAGEPPKGAWAEPGPRTAVSLLLVQDLGTVSALGLLR